MSSRYIAQCMAPFPTRTVPFYGTVTVQVDRSLKIVLPMALLLSNTTDVGKYHLLASRIERDFRRNGVMITNLRGYQWLEEQLLLRSVSACLLL